MPGSTAADDTARHGGSLARTYQLFAERIKATSPVYGRISLAVSSSAPALHAIEVAPARKRRPALILAALHHLALAGQAPALALALSATEAATGSAAVVDAAIDVLTSLPDSIAAIAASRRVCDAETHVGAVLYPAIVEVARRTGARRVGLVDVGKPTPLNLLVDGMGVSYDNGQAMGDAASPVQLTCSVVGGRPLPQGVVPDVAARISVGRELLDLKDADDALWLRACVPPDRPDRAAQIDAAIALAAPASPWLLVAGDPGEELPAVLARVPDDALPVITTTWALSGVRPADRVQFYDRLRKVAHDRPLAWVSVEGVGVAPTVSTLGDRPASGHSLVGLVMLDRDGARAETVGRCWRRGTMLAWLAAEPRR